VRKLAFALIPEACFRITRRQACQRAERTGRPPHS